MALNSLEQLLDQMDRAKRSFGQKGGEQVRKLDAIGHRDLSDPELLIRFHEQLLMP